VKRPSDLSDAELHAWMTFFQMQEVLRGRIEQQLQGCSGLSIADYSVLAVLSGAPGGRLRAFHLGATMGWEKSRLHHQLTRMAKRGLIERQAGDGRATYVALTPKGRETLTVAAPRHSGHVRELFIDCLTPQQVGQLADISATVLANLRQAEHADQE
jgi:DNA-binding MarR family transcriptional regulator